MSRFKADGHHAASKKAIDRMDLMCMIPLEIDPKNKSPENLSALDQQYDIYQNAVSSFSATLEYHGNDIGELPPQKPPRIRHKQRRVTPYITPIVPTKSTAPEPASYYPCFAPTQPTVPKLFIGEIPSKPRKKLIGQTNNDIIALYDHSLRTFDPSMVENVDFSRKDLQVQPIQDTVHIPDFNKMSKRKIQFHVASDAPDTDFYIPPIPKPIVPTFAGQSDRTEFIPQDDGRDYHDKAVAQLKKLQEPPQIRSFDGQILRGYKAAPNKRVTFLDRLSKEQNQLLEELRPKKTSQSALNTRKKPEPFAVQATRDSRAVYPQVTQDSHYPCNPAKSLQAIMPRVPAITIHSRPEVKDSDFWCAHRGN